MFDIGSSELLLIIIVAIVVIGPKDLPRALYKVGQVVGKARGMARHFRTGLDAMVREAELEELQKQWARENERIMRETQLPGMSTSAPASASAADGAPAPALESPGASPEGTSTAESASPPGEAVPPSPSLAGTDQPSLPLDGGTEPPKGSAA
ncbi:Sec-independent protein translocase protein TatB [Sphingobium lignivorans]|uniref:Sec-independent protein translocase protein TatB n=1 Tax=Sphingobium lignivorans TaxID=2735886 RepID=A0ABR6NBC5_9SPHN|nr:Sec-independent protein translocase protein TatB [Sphingobium lignivorans]MBB5984575.1 sec-independent protein translocase protein TatB [Sphingobium lignivorans]